MDPARPAAPAPPRAAAPPTVAFVDTGEWDAFFQLAAAIRRRGCRVVRLSTRRGPAHRLVSALLFHRFVELDGPGQLAELGALLAGERVADLQATEGLLEAVCGGLGAWAPAALDAAVRARLALVDKVHAAGHMAAAGARVPDFVVLDATTRPDDVVARLGLPVVVKVRVGASGAGVALARTPAELAACLAGAGDDGASYAERFVDGETLSYGAVVGPDGVVGEILTRSWRRRTDSLGPATDHETLEDAELVACCRRVASVPGYRGPVQIDMLRDPSGTVWFHDLNLRAWSGLGWARRAGVDFVDAYLWAIGVGARRPEPVAATPGVHYAVFPTDAAQELAQGRPLRAAACVVRAAVPSLRWFGARFLATELVSLALLVEYLLSGWVGRRLRRGRAPAPGAGPAHEGPGPGAGAQLDGR